MWSEGGGGEGEEGRNVMDCRCSNCPIVRFRSRDSVSGLWSGLECRACPVERQVAPPCE